MLTLIVPTMNRSEFLARLLYYYVSTNYKHQILIADASNSVHLEKTKKVIREIGGKLNVRLLELPEVNIAASIKELTLQITTPYAAYVSDDDFLIPKALEECLAFLDGNPSYSAAHGEAILFSLVSSGAYGDIEGVGPYYQSPIEGESASERLLSHLEKYSVTLFSVFRTDTWRNMYSEAESAPDRAFMEELLPCALSVVYGKVKQFDCLYLVRQGHDNRAFHVDAYDWITNQNWLPSYQVFNNRLTRELVRQDGVETEDARKVVKQAFWKYLDKAQNVGYNKVYGYEQRGIGKRTKNIVKKIPYVRKAFNILQSVFYPSNHLSLPVLLSKRSSYHNDFMPVYRAVTKDSGK